MTLDINFFRQVMGRFATGVTIATTRSQAGIAGLTVNSFTSVSLSPMLVLICVDLHSQALPFFRESGVFAVNILTEEQEELSNCFATSSEERYTFFCHATHYRAATGAPILDGVLGFVDARIMAEYPGGDHVIFLGQVEAMGYSEHVFFLPGVESASCTLPDLVDTTNHTSSNGHAPTSERTPLLYYRGRYRRLSAPPSQPAPPELTVVPTQKDA